MAFPVLLDACVLVPYRLADLLLWLAEAELYQPLWSDEILEEVRRTLVSPKIGVAPEKANRRIAQMRDAFPFASVTGYQGLVSGLTNDTKDRHVLAAAVRGHAALIVTSNLKDFPAAALAPYDIEAIHPDDFLLDQLDLAEERTLKCLVAQRVRYKKPTVAFTDFYSGLAVTVPKFALKAQVLDANESFPSGLPLPLELVSGDDAFNAFFPDGKPDPTTPLGAAYIWYFAVSHLDEFGELAASLSANPPVWNGYGSAAEVIAGLSMMQVVEPNPERPDLISYVKLIDTGGHAMRSFSESVLRDVQILTLVACPDGLWRIWSISPNYFPPVSEVLGQPSDDGPLRS
jgi:predicted nucleic acid-binding protein